MDLPALLEQFGDAREILDQVIDTYLEQYPQLLAEVGRAVATRDPAALSTSAHKFKGALSIFAGFLFWAGLAYLYYTRNLGGALILALGFVAGMAVYGWMRRRPKRPPRPRSDLPEFKFDNVKPKDFE